MQVNSNQNNILILGGMGSRASTKFLMHAYDFIKGIDDHLLPRVILDNSTDIPSRGRYFEGIGENPAPKIIERINEYEEKYVIQRIYIPCNTVHLLKDELIQYKDKWVDLPTTVIKSLVQEKYKNVLIVGSKATIESKLYRDQRDVNFEYADLEINKVFVAEIYERKKGNTWNRNKNKSIIERLYKKYDAVLLACTELEEFECVIPVISSLRLYAEELARNMIQEARSNVD